MKALILFGNGACDVHYMNTTNTPLQLSHHPNIDQLTQLGSTTKLHVRTSASLHENKASELLQLFDIYDDDDDNDDHVENININNNNNNNNNNSVGDDDNSGNKNRSIIAKRYHNMRLKLLTNDQSVLEIMSQYESNVQLIPQNKWYTIEEIKKELEQVDVLLIHYLPISDNMNDKIAMIEHMDQMISCTDAYMTREVLQVVIMSYDDYSTNADVSYNIVATNTNAAVNDNNNMTALLKKPVQSYTRKKTKLVENVRHMFPMYSVCYNDGSTRRDYNELFTERTCENHAGNDGILADHFFGELAYKLCFSDKYGA
jgi:hypothetical protein